jgi:hypothetical protein
MENDYSHASIKTVKNADFAMSRNYIQISRSAFRIENGRCIKSSMISWGLGTCCSTLNSVNWV